MAARRLLADQRGSSAASCRVHTASRATVGLRCATAPRAGLPELLQPCRLAWQQQQGSGCANGQEHRSAA